MKKVTSLLLTVMLIFLASSSVLAQNKEFTDLGADSYWDTPANWSDNTVPVANDDVYIPNGLTVVLRNSVTARSLTLDGTVKGNTSSNTYNINLNPTSTDDPTQGDFTLDVGTVGALDGQTKIDISAFDGNYIQIENPNFRFYDLNINRSSLISTTGRVIVDDTYITPGSVTAPDASVINPVHLYVTNQLSVNTNAELEFIDQTGVFGSMVIGGYIGTADAAHMDFEGSKIYFFNDVRLDNTTYGYMTLTEGGEIFAYQDFQINSNSGGVNWVFQPTNTDVGAYITRITFLGSENAVFNMGNHTAVNALPELVVNKSTATTTVTLNKNITVGGTIDIQKGKLQDGGYTLTFQGTTMQTHATNGSHVSDQNSGSTYNGKITLAGTAGQPSIKGNFGNFDYGNLTNTTDGSLWLAGDVTISGKMTLTYYATLDLMANDITFDGGYLYTTTGPVVFSKGNPASSVATNGTLSLENGATLRTTDVDGIDGILYSITNGFSVGFETPDNDENYVFELSGLAQGYAGDSFPETFNSLSVSGSLSLSDFGGFTMNDLIFLTAGGTITLDGTGISTAKVTTTGAGTIHVPGLVDQETSIYDGGVTGYGSLLVTGSSPSGNGMLYLFPTTDGSLKLGGGGAVGDVTVDGTWTYLISDFGVADININGNASQGGSLDIMGKTLTVSGTMKLMNETERFVHSNGKVILTTTTAGDPLPGSDESDRFVFYDLTVNSNAIAMTHLGTPQNIATGMLLINAGSVSLDGSLDLAGSLVINANGVLHQDAAEDIFVGGDCINNSGKFSSTGTIILDSGNDYIGGFAETDAKIFNLLLLGNDEYMNGDVTITGTLYSDDPTGNVLEIRDNILTLDGSATTETSLKGSTDATLIVKNLVGNGELNPGLTLIFKRLDVNSAGKTLTLPSFTIYEQLNVVEGSLDNRGSSVTITGDQATSIATASHNGVYQLGTLNVTKNNGVAVTVGGTNDIETAIQVQGVNVSSGGLTIRGTLITNGANGLVVVNGASDGIHSTSGDAKVNERLALQNNITLSGTGRIDNLLVDYGDSNGDDVVTSTGSLVVGALYLDGTLDLNMAGFEFTVEDNIYNDYNGFGSAAADGAVTGAGTLKLTMTDVLFAFGPQSDLTGVDLMITNGGSMSGANVEVKNLDVDAGILELWGLTLDIVAGNAITGNFGATNFIATNNGTLKQNVAADTEVAFPIGSNDGADTYYTAFTLTNQGTMGALDYELGFRDEAPTGTDNDNDGITGLDNIVRPANFYWVMKPSNTFYGSLTLKLNHSNFTDKTTAADEVKIVYTKLGNRSVAGSWSQLGTRTGNIYSEGTFTNYWVMTQVGTNLPDDQRAIFQSTNYAVTFGLNVLDFANLSVVFYQNSNTQKVLVPAAANILLGKNILTAGTDVNLNDLGHATNLNLEGTVSYSGSNGVDFGDQAPYDTPADGEGYYLSLEGTLAQDALDNFPWPSGGVNSTDAIAVVHYLVSRDNPIDDNVGTSHGTTLGYIADVTQDGSIKINDALQILKRSVGYSDAYDVNWFVDANTSRLLPELTATVNGTVRLYAYGDVKYVENTDEGNYWSGNLLTTKNSKASLKQEGEISIDPTAEFELPISVTGKAKVAAFTLKLDYPSDLVTFEGVNAGFEDVIYEADEEEGVIKIVWLDATAKDNLVALKKNDVLLNLVFSPKEALKKAKEFPIALRHEGTSFSDENANLVQVELVAPKVGGFIPKEFSISQNYPNPFNPVTKLDYALPENAKVSIKVYNILGEVVATLINDQIQEPGWYNLEWNATRFASGVYIYRIIAQGESKKFTQVKKMMLLK